ncbi:MAG: lysophospholipid acyltransferase family protein [Pseudomonadota bacterium]
MAIVFMPSLLRQPWALWASQLWTRMVLWGLKVICGIDEKVSGQQHLPPGPALIAAKHQSMWETVYLASTLPHPSFVLKKELGRIPIFGWWCARSGYIFVDRDAGAKALRKMVGEAKKAFDRGASHIIIFPEGTRTAVGDTALFQPGVAALAKALNVPILPVAHNSGGYWQHHTNLKVPGTIHLEYLPPMEEGLSRTELMAQLQNRIETTTQKLMAEADDALAMTKEAHAHDHHPA